MQEKWKIPLGDGLPVYTETPEKPLESDRCVSYRINLTFSGFVSGAPLTFILLNENIKAWSCQWNGYKDNIRSQDAINYANKAAVQISTVLKDERFLKTSLHSLPHHQRDGGKRFTSPITWSQTIIWNLSLPQTSPCSFIYPLTNYIFTGLLSSIVLPSTSPPKFVKIQVFMNLHTHTNTSPTSTRIHQKLFYGSEVTFWKTL